MGKSIEKGSREKTSNLSKAHVTRYSSGPATWAVVYSMQ